MCGRYSFILEDELIWERFGVRVRTAVYKARYNCAPGQELAVISNEDPRNLQFFRWGLIPSWSKDPGVGNKMINVKSETILEKASFREPFKRRRCLVPADGFYEWRKEKEKTPYRFTLKDGSPFAFAGIWNEWKHPDGQSIRTFSILTTGPNELTGQVHDRMPVILRKEDETNWLSVADEKKLLAMLNPYPAGEMTCYPVSRLVNSPTNDNPDVILPSPGELF